MKYDISHLIIKMFLGVKTFEFMLREENGKNKPSDMLWDLCCWRKIDSFQGWKLSNLCCGRKMEKNKPSDMPWDLCCGRKMEKINCQICFEICAGGKWKKYQMLAARIEPLTCNLKDHSTNQLLHRNFSKLHLSYRSVVI